MTDNSGCRGLEFGAITFRSVTYIREESRVWLVLVLVLVCLPGAGNVLSRVACDVDSLPISHNKLIYLSPDFKRHV